MFGISLPGMWLYLGAFLIGLAAGGGGGYAVRGLVDRPVIDELKIDVAQGKTDLANSETRMKGFQAQVEQDRADANLKALNDQRASDAKQQALQIQLAQAQAARARTSMALTEALKTAEALGMASPLSPAVQAYVESVRQQQELAP